MKRAHTGQSSSSRPRVPVLCLVLPCFGHSASSLFQGTLRSPTDNFGQLCNSGSTTCNSCVLPGVQCLCSF